MEKFDPKSATTVPHLYNAYCDGTLVSFRAPYEVPRLMQRLLAHASASNEYLEIGQRLNGKPIVNLGCGTIDLAKAYEELAFNALQAPTLFSVDPYNLLSNTQERNHSLIRADGVGFLRGCGANSSHVITSSLDEHVFMGRLIEANCGIEQSHWNERDRELWGAGQAYIERCVELIVKVIGDKHLWISYCSSPFEEYARKLGLREYKVSGDSMVIFYQSDSSRLAA